MREKTDEKLEPDLEPETTDAPDPDEPDSTDAPDDNAASDSADAPNDDSADDDSADDGSDESTDATPTRRWAGKWGSGEWLVAVLSGVLFVAVVSVAVLGYQVYQADQIDTARSQALAAAKAAAPDVLSYDYRHLEKDFEQASQHLTGKFAKDYQTTTRRGVERLAGEVHAVVTAKVQASSVVSANNDQVVVLLYVNQTIKSDVRKNAKLPDQNRVRMTMDRVDDRWLVSKLEAL